MTSQDQPLWRVMQSAYFEGHRPGSCEHRGYAAEIEVLRDLIVPEEPEYPMGTCGIKQLQREERDCIRAQLTAEAEKARVGE
jgi:hypothetical protein